MFENARLKLTLWYLVVIMLVSGFFSLIVYIGFSKELGRGFRMQSMMGIPQGQVILRRPGYQRILPFVIYPDDVAPEEYIEIVNYAKKRFALQLLIINGGILILAGTSGYFLAGKTLRPIEIAMDEQKRFIADASHEFKTPLTALQTAIEVSLRDKKLSIKEARQILEENLDDVKNLTSLSNYLLSLAKFQIDSNLIKEKVNTKDLINNTVKKFSSVAKNKKIEINVDLENIFVQTNQEGLSKVLTILLDNAVKYSHEKSSINITAKKYSNHIILSIKDQGIGISTKDLPHIFERFYRADTSRSKSVDGFGLGLSIAQQITKSLNGKIWAESKVDKGSVFKIKLPKK